MKVIFFLTIIILSPIASALISEFTFRRYPKASTVGLIGVFGIGVAVL